MTVDENLLAAAKTAADRFSEADREADLARANYHHAVRRLHLAGATVREVAQALGMSHQRVQQIVQANGGTWWSSIWRGRKVRPDMVCSFCGRPSAQVSKLIAGPKVYICDACVRAAEQVLAGNPSHDAAGGGPMELVPFGSRQRCSFCRKRARHFLVKVKAKAARAEHPDDFARYLLTQAANAKAGFDLRIVKSGDKGVCDNCLEICRRILEVRTEGEGKDGR